VNTPSKPRAALQQLGPYIVGAKIAHGGMATLYLGCSKDDPDGVVALKVIKDELAVHEGYVHMFLDEAKILSSLSHPNIIRTLEYGVTGDQRFIAMELLLGRPLADVWDLVAARSERVPLVLGAWIAAEVASGLHHAHELPDEKGQPLHVIHRDVNPTNIFLTYDGEVKLIDFGLAKARGRRYRSGAGIVKGKLPYLSPEQVRDPSQEPIDVDRRVDLFALGTTLWELGSGKRLFKRDSDLATIEAIRKAEIPDLRNLFSDYPDAIWNIVKRSLARDRDERYATADEMRRELDAFVEGQGVGAATLESYLSELFPGERTRQARWLQEVTALRDSKPSTQTVPPPVPVASMSAMQVAAASPSGKRLPDDSSEPELANAPKPERAPEPLVRESPHGHGLSSASIPLPPEARQSHWTVVTIGVTLGVLALAALFSAFR
jgi:serine/threonine-protein kinase